jgi:hypothetical protein
MKTSTGAYVTSNLNEAAIAGASDIGAPGSEWTVKAFVRGPAAVAPR